jgi:hypothetical protein
MASLNCFTIEAMPTVLRLRGYRFYFFAEEGNEPPHIHVDKAEGTLKLWLADLSIASSEGLKPAEIRTALKIARQHQHLFQESWDEFNHRKS